MLMVHKYKLFLTFISKEDISKFLSHQYLASKHKWVDFGFFFFIFMLYLKDAYKCFCHQVVLFNFCLLPSSKNNQEEPLVWIKSTINQNIITKMAYFYSAPHADPWLPVIRVAIVFIFSACVFSNIRFNLIKCFLG